MTQAVVAGHVCLDLIPLFDPARPAQSLSPGSLVHVGHATWSTGGAVPNTGLALHRLGVPVTLMGKVGNDLFGDEVMRLLAAHGPGLTAGMAVTTGEATSYSVVISPPGIDRTFLHCPGANDTFGPEDMRWDRARGARLLHFGYPPAMRRMYVDGGAAMAEIFAEAKRRGMATSLDLCGITPGSEADEVDWPKWLARVLPHVDFFLPSLDETLRVLRLRAAARDEVDAALLRQVAERLLEMGPAVVTLKLGEDGLYLRSARDGGRLQRVGSRLLADVEAWRARELTCPCFRARVVGTTGSGDCTIAGFLAAVLSDASPEASLTMACATGACSVEAADAVGGVRPWGEVVSRLSTGWEQHPSHPDLKEWRQIGDSILAGPEDVAFADA